MYGDYDDGDWTAGFRSRETWVRGFFMLLFLAALWLARILLAVVAVFQFCAQLIRRRPVARLLPFGRSLAIYLQQIAQFLTFNTEERPFPFSPWPDPGDLAADHMDDEYPAEDAPFEEYEQPETPDAPPPEPDYGTAPAVVPEEEETSAEGETSAEEEGAGEPDQAAEEEPEDKEPPRPDA